jgi:hypothetical protein
VRGVVRTVLMAASLTNNQRHRPRQQSDSGAWVITSTRLTSTVGTTSQAVTMILPASLVPSVDQNVLTMEGYQNVDQNVDQAADRTSIVTTHPRNASLSTGNRYVPPRPTSRAGLAPDGVSWQGEWAPLDGGQDNGFRYESCPLGHNWACKTVLNACIAAREFGSGITLGII